MAWTFCAGFAKNSRHRVLPVIMVTAKTQSEDIVEALKIGANDYVTKPVDLSIVLARVNNQVARRRAEAAIRKANESLLNAMTHLEQRVALEKKIAHLAHHDMLTGLPNQFAFDEKLNAARQFARDSGSQLSLLFIDLDGFKNVNDALGHAVGDEFLKEVAARLTNVVGTSDFCSRLGGRRVRGCSRFHGCSHNGRVARASNHLGRRQLQLRWRSSGLRRRERRHLRARGRRQ